MSTGAGVAYLHSEAGRLIPVHPNTAEIDDLNLKMLSRAPKAERALQVQSCGVMAEVEFCALLRIPVSNTATVVASSETVGSFFLAAQGCRVNKTGNILKIP